MATGTAPPNTTAPPEAPHPYADLIEDHVRRTQGYLRGCDVAQAVITIVVFMLGYLMAMAVVDHWLWTGGLGKGPRALAFLVMLGAVALYSWWALVPHLIRRINPVYAADRLEHAQPTLMNSLVNFLMLRSEGGRVPEAVMRGLERQAATGIEHLPAEAAVDRTKLLRIAYVLVGVFLVFALYVWLSPKSPFTSAARILVPWADIPPVTRVRIEKVAPGTGDVYRGEPATVTAEIRGLRDDDTVTLRYASVDGQVENQSVTMQRSEGQTAYSCQLPSDAAGMQRDLIYHIEAGDAPLKEYRLTVIPAPTIQIEDIEYHYPKYTRLAPLKTERQGDIKALEGTTVLVRAKASQPIGKAMLELTGRKEKTLLMDSRGELAARGALLLKLVPFEGKLEQEFLSYKLAVTDARGHRNREPAAYRIEVVPDRPPSVDILDPKERDIELPADKDLNLDVRARDADFALSDLRIVAMRKGEKLVDESLIAGQKLRLDQPVRVNWKFVPAKHKLQPGDEILLRAVAIDNREPQPNRQRSTEIRVVITAPAEPPALEPPDMKREDMQRDDMQSDKTADQQRNPGAKSPPGEQGNAGEKRDNNDQPGKKPENNDPAQINQQKQEGNGNKREGQPDGGPQGKNDDHKQQENPDSAQGSEGAQQGSDGDGGKKDGAGEAASGNDGNNDPLSDDEAVQRVVKYLEELAKKKQEDAKNKPGNSGDKSPKDETQLAREDARPDKPDNKQQQPQDSQKQDHQNQQGTKSGDQKSGDQKSGDQKQNAGENGSQQGDQKQDSQQQDSQQKGNQKEQGDQKDGKGQQKQPQSGSGGKSGSQGAAGNGAPGNSSGMGDASNSADNKQSGSPSGSNNQNGNGNSSSSGAQQQNGSPGDNRAGSQRSGSTDGAGQADARRSTDQSGKPTGQRQPGDNQSGSSAPEDKSAGAQNRPGGVDPVKAISELVKAAEKLRQLQDKVKGQGQPTDKRDSGNPSDNSQDARDQSGKPDKGNQVADKSGSNPSNNNDNNKNPQDGTQPGNKSRPGDQIAARDPNSANAGSPQSGQPQTAKQPNQNDSNQPREGSDAGRQPGDKTGEKADSSQRGMNPGDRQPRQQPEKQPENGAGSSPQVGGPQGQEQKDGNRSEGGRPGDQAKEVASKSGDSSSNKSGGQPKDQPQQRSAAPNNTPGKGNKPAPSEGASSDENSQNKERQRPSDTQGGDGGPKAGKGKEGPGQASSGAGTGGAGKSQAADDGGSRSNESGPGDQSNRAGDQQKSDQPTGQASKESGDAQAGRPEDSGAKSGSAQGASDMGTPGAPNPKAQPGTQMGEGTPVAGKPTADPNGTGGESGVRSGPGQHTPGGPSVAGSEKANLDYARRATDLTLGYLQDQLAKGKINDDLRKRLGWSDEEFQSLLKRMQTMRDRATDAKARPEDKAAYEQWLKSLGLRPSTGAVRTGREQAKALDNSRDDAPVSVPRDLREQHEAFRQGLLEKQ